MTAVPVEVGALLSPRFDAQGNPRYAPCFVGLHLCGFASPDGDPDREQPYTALNLPARDHAHAQAMFDAARAEAECGKDEADFCCDLDLGSPTTGPDHSDDFWTNRQLVPRLASAAIRARTRAQSGEQT